MFYYSPSNQKIMETNETKKQELINSIISQLTDDPNSDKEELILAFFEIANNAPNGNTVCAFQRLFFILKDAQELKQLM